MEDRMRTGISAVTTVAPWEEAIRFLATQPGYAAPERMDSTADAPVHQPPNRTAATRLIAFGVVIACACGIIPFVGPDSLAGVFAGAGSTSPWTVDTLKMVAAAPGMDTPTGELMSIAVPVSGTPSTPENQTEALELSKRNAVSAATRHLGHEPPHDIQIPSRGIVGPSGGLMFALAIVELLDGDDLTHGRRIAGTGTIDPSGAVGTVGRVAEKAIRAESAGVHMLLVPAPQADEAAAAAPRLRVVGVQSLDEAVETLRSG
jgi:hypothetical protein